MPEVRRAMAEGAVKFQLARGCVEQVGAAHHIGDAHQCIVHHHGQLVGEDAVSTAHHEVAGLPLQVLFLFAGNFVVKDDGARRHFAAQCKLFFTVAQAAVAAGAGVNRMLSAVGRACGFGDVFARAAAWKKFALAAQSIQRVQIKFFAL